MTCFCHFWPLFFLHHLTFLFIILLFFLRIKNFFFSIPFLVWCQSAQMSSYSWGLIICSKTSRMSLSFGNSNLSDRTHSAKLSTTPWSMEGYQRLTPGSVHLPSWPDRWRHTSEGTGIQSSMYGSWWTLSPKLGGERFLLGQSSGFWCCGWISVVWEGVGRLTRSCRWDSFFSQIWDLYHRMWNDIRAGVLAAKGQRFLLFAYNACNACFGPWNTHANFDTRKGLVQRLVVQFLCIFASGSL